ncbi:MAG: acetyl-CoA decarbonylase/synthase complex subunit alpha, partial [Asgard group archaeon]
MGRKFKARMDKLELPTLRAENLELVVGSLITTELDEVSGPTPFPKVETLREWDLKLINRYPMFYAPFTDNCELCTFGKCDLTAGKRGACGIDTSTQQGRIILLACCIGLTCHAAHARHLLDYYIEKYGRNIPISAGEGVNVEAPITRLICGIKPETIGDLVEPMEYIEEQVVQLLAATHTGQEGSAIDYESKALHAGMLDLLAMEICDVAQISALGFPKADPEAPLIELGYGVINVEKPVILCVGHNVVPGAEIIDYLETMGQLDNVEVCAICCTAIDISRYRKTAKVVGSMSHQMKFIRSGVPDVIVLDEQCI